jgi:hypothetical protein
MAHQEYIDQLITLTESEEVLSVSKSVNELRSKFDDYVLEEERKQQIAQIEAEEKNEEFLGELSDFGKETFYEIFNAYKVKRSQKISDKKEEEQKNLQHKKSLIKRLQDVITQEENIGAAFSSFKEIQDEWKEVGDIPRDNRNDIQSDYSKLIEDFFYNIKIYKDLKDHDYHRNEQLKTEVIERLKGLKEIKSIKEVEQQLKLIQNEFDEIGPVPNEKWEVIKDAYWTEVRSVYERINRFYEDRKTIQIENLAKKEALLKEATHFVEETLNSEEAINWDAKTNELIAFQNTWKTIGFGPKKENEIVWKSFRAVCDQFFEAKKTVFEKIHAEYNGIADKKIKLIEKVEALKTSTDWKETSNQIIQLQKQWKTIGHAGKKHEQKLWKKFRASCDAFFNARQKHFEEADKEFDSNLELKNQLLDKIESFKLPADKKEAINTLRAFSTEFNEIGKVPMKVKDAVYNRFKQLMDNHYGSIKLEGAEKQKALFEAKIDTIQASSDSGKMLDKMKFELRKDIEKIQKEVALLENNLGFFANSKGANALKLEVEKKVQAANNQIKELRNKIKLIPNE